MYANPRAYRLGWMNCCSQIRSALLFACCIAEEISGVLGSCHR
ncbi:MAG: hypothetical protein AAF085_01985 [Planctomycetota bacterium]